MEGQFKKILLNGALFFVVFYIKTAYGATEINTIIVTDIINTTAETTKGKTTQTYTTLPDSTQVSTSYSDTTQASTNAYTESMTSSTTMENSTALVETTQTSTTSSATTQTSETPPGTTQASTTSASTTQTSETPSSTMTQISRTPTDTTQASTTSKTTPPFTSAKTVRASTSRSGTTSSKGSNEEQFWYKEDWVIPVFVCAGAVILVLLLCLVCQCGRQGNIGRQLTMIGSGERLRRWSHRVTQTFDTNNHEDRDVEDGHNVNMSSFTKPQIDTANVDTEKLPEKNDETKLNSTNVQSTETAEQASEVVDIEHKKLDNTNVKNVETEEAREVDDGGEHKKPDTTDVQNAGTEQALDTGNTKSAGDETLEKSPVESKSINQEEEMKPSTVDATPSAVTDKLIQRDDDVKSGEVNLSAELSDATDADAANTTHSTEPISEL